MAEYVVGKRILILGVSSSGKTTLAGQMAEILNYHHIQRDQITLTSDATKLDKAQRRLILQDAFKSSECWIADGNGFLHEDFVQPEPDTLIWIQLPIWVNIWYALHRIPNILLRSKTSWSDHIELSLYQRIRFCFWLIIRPITTYQVRTRDIKALYNQYKTKQQHVIHLKSRDDVRNFLQCVVIQE